MINNKHILISILIGLYSISNTFVYFKTSYIYQVKQINNLHILLDETNNKYDGLNKQYNKLNQEIIDLNHKIDILKNRKLIKDKEMNDKEVNDKEVNDKKREDKEINDKKREEENNCINVVSIIDNDFVETICLDYENVNIPIQNYEVDIHLLKPNNTIMKIFNTFF